MRKITMAVAQCYLIFKDEKCFQLRNSHKNGHGVWHRMLSQNHCEWVGLMIQGGTNKHKWQTSNGRPSKRSTQHGMPQASTDSLIDMKNASLGMAIISKNGL